MESFAAEHHAALGAEVLKRWQLPSRLQEPVRFHHAPAAAGAFRAYAEVAYVANRLSHRYGFGCSASAPDDSEELLTDPFVAGLGITPGTLGELDRRAPGLFEIARQIVLVS